MTNSRRITLQLTPLIDLLMVVMFAQYMEIRIAAERQAEKASSERQVAVDENETLREKVTQFRDRVDQWESHQRTLNHKQQKETEQLGELIRELFQIPDATLNKVIQPRSKGEAGGLSPAEIADLKARFQQLANSRGDQVVDHLLAFNEMRKQFDIWEFYLSEYGNLLITVGPDRQQFQSKVIDSPETFVDAVLQVRKQFPPTKNSVLILCRYGDCLLLHKLSMMRGLPVIADRLKSDGQGKIHFEYAVFGYRPQPELEQK